MFLSCLNVNIHFTADSVMHSRPRSDFYRATLCVSASFAVARCPSVCLSVTLVHSIHTAEDIVKLICRPGSPIIVVFSPQRRYPIPRRTPSVGTQNRRGWENLRFSTEIAVYLGNGIRDRPMVTMER